MVAVRGVPAWCRADPVVLAPRHERGAALLALPGASCHVVHPLTLTDAGKRKVTTWGSRLLIILCSLVVHHQVGGMSTSPVSFATKADCGPPSGRRPQRRGDAGDRDPGHGTDRRTGRSVAEPGSPAGSGGIGDGLLHRCLRLVRHRGSLRS